MKSGAQRTFEKFRLMGTLSEPQTPCCKHGASGAQIGVWKFVPLFHPCPIPSKF